MDIKEYKSLREYFSKDEWVDLLLQSIGLNPDQFTFRGKLIQLARLIPYVENNYNLIELGPKGTGKSHIYSEMSPHGMLISGGEVSQAKLFVNNSNGQIGLVGYWDNVAFDEFAGVAKRVDKNLVDTMKNYMANKSFSRGSSPYGASASFSFVGNTMHSVSYMMKHSDLFEALPAAYHDSAFLDRIHSYLPGWEVQKLRNDMFTNDYGFIVDYLAEVLKELRKEDRTNDYAKFFILSDTITTRDKTSIDKSFAGLVKIIYPHGQLNETEAKELIDFAIENRKRVKQQLQKIDSTFEDVDFSYTIKSSSQQVEVETLEIEEHYGRKQQLAKELSTISNTKAAPKLAGGHKIIRDNQTGISYNNLFGDYLKGVTDIKIIDPYIRLPYQLKNFMEFVSLIVNKKEHETEVKLHLVTSNDHGYINDVTEAFNSMQETMEDASITFTYEFDENAHDRSINLNNGWKIILGRGLDIWQRSGDWYNLNSYVQERRLCKGFEITFLINQ